MLASRQRTQLGWLRQRSSTVPELLQYCFLIYFSINGAATAFYVVNYGISMLQSAINALFESMRSFNSIHLSTLFNFLVILVCLDRYSLDVGSTDGSSVGAVRGCFHRGSRKQFRDKPEYLSRRLRRRSYLRPRTVERGCPSIGQVRHPSLVVNCNRANESTFPRFSWFKVCGEKLCSAPHYPRIRVCKGDPCQMSSHWAFFRLHVCSQSFFHLSSLFEGGLLESPDCSRRPQHLS